MSTVSIALILGAITLVAALAFSPSFRQLFRIRSGKAIDAGTTALEKEQDQYKLLTARIPAQRNSVATTKAGAVIAQKKLNGLTEKLTGLEPSSSRLMPRRLRPTSSPPSKPNTPRPKLPSPSRRPLPPRPPRHEDRDLRRRLGLC